MRFSRKKTKEKQIQTIYPKKQRQQWRNPLTLRFCPPCACCDSEKYILRFWLGSKNIFKVPDPVQKNLFTVSVPYKWFQVPSTESHWARHIFKMKKYKMLLNLIWITKCYGITYIPAEILRLTNITVKSPCPHGFVFFFETQKGRASPKPFANIFPWRFFFKLKKGSVSPYLIKKRQSLGEIGRASCRERV